VAAGQSSGRGGAAWRARGGPAERGLGGGRARGATRGAALEQEVASGGVA
jgi:hypothetical protein